MNRLPYLIAALVGGTLLSCHIPTVPLGSEEGPHVEAIRSAVSTWIARAHPRANLVFYDQGAYPEILEDDYVDLEFLCGSPIGKNFPLFVKGTGRGRYVPLGIHLTYPASVDEGHSLTESEIMQLHSGEISFETGTIFINQTILISEINGHIVAIVKSSSDLSPFRSRNIDMFVFHITDDGIVLETVESGYT